MQLRMGRQNRWIVVRSVSLAIGAILLLGPARACLWDTDTIAEEYKHFPSAVEAIVGWFDRNPPLYYQMRLDRCLRDLPSHPQNLNLYDDAAVSSDRLGKDDQAIALLAKKQAQLSNMDSKFPDVQHHWYTYYSNLGTVHLIRWLVRGHKKAEVHEVQLAEQLIGKALKLNPNAHFGREPVQFKVMTWMEAVTLKPDDAKSLFQLANRSCVPGEMFPSQSGAFMQVLGLATATLRFSGQPDTTSPFRDPAAFCGHAGLAGRPT